MLVGIRILGIVGAFGGIFAYCAFRFGEADKETADILIKKIKPLFIVWLIIIIGGLFIPTTKEMAVIYLLPKVAHNEGIQKIPNQALKLLNFKLQEWLDDRTVKED